MWRRLRRRSLAPSRPALYPDQLGLALLSLAALGGGIYLVIRIARELSAIAPLPEAGNLDLTCADLTGFGGSRGTVG